MSNSIKDQLLQKGLITEEQVQQAEQSDRRKRPPRKSPGRASTRGPARDKEDGMFALVEYHRVNVPVRGQRRWYFETRDGRLPYLAVSHPCAELLERGGAAIVELPTGTHKIINREGAEKLQALDPTSVRFWNSSESAT